MAILQRASDPTITEALRQAMQPATFVFLIALLILFGEAPRKKIASFFEDVHWRIWLIPLAIWASYLAIGALSGALYSPTTPPYEFAKIAAYFAIPTIFVILARKFPRFKIYFDGLAVFCLWHPMMVGWIGKEWFGGTQGHYLMMGAGGMYGLLVFGGIRKFNIQARWELSGQDLKWIFAIFAIISIPVWCVGRYFGFIQPGLHPFFLHQQYAILLIALHFLFANGIPEELLFRGVLQSAIRRRLGPLGGHRWGSTLTVLATALLFGSSHLFAVRIITNASGVITNGFPNLPYALMAFLGGIAFGTVFELRKSLLAAVILHALVNTVWVLFFGG